MQGWIPACSPTAHEPLSFQNAASTDPTPGLSSHPIFPRSTSIYSLCGRELGPAGKDTSCWSCSSTMQYLQGCPTSSRSFSFSTTSRGPAFFHPHRVLPPWLHLGRLPPLPMGFQDRIFQAQPGLRSRTPAPRAEDITCAPEVLPSPTAPVWAARVLLRALAGLVVAGRQTTTHGPPKSTTL